MTTQDPFVKCRCCLVGAAATFSLYSHQKILCITYADMVMACCSLKMEDRDEKPSHICLECSRKLAAAYDFREMCRRSDSILNIELEHPSLHNADIKKEPVDFLQFEMSEENDEAYSDRNASQREGNTECTLINSDVNECIFEKHIKQEEENSDRVATEKQEVKPKIKNKFSAVSGTRQCKLCSLHFGTRLKFAEHMRTVHPKIMANFDCKCGAVFARKVDLRRHILDAHGARTFSCALCPKKFTLKLKLRVHMQRSHSGQQSYRCNICKDDFKTSGELKSHAAVHVEEGIQIKSEPEDFCCSNLEGPSQELEIKREYVDEGSVETAKIEGTSEPNVSKPTDKRRDLETVCSLCDAQCLTRTRLQEHVKWVHMGIKYYCKLCKKHYTSESRHNKNAHGSGKHCTLCDSFFDSKTKYENHVRRAHPEDNRRTCHLCNHFFKSERARDRHMERTHADGLHKYICPYCTKIFQYKSSLDSHLIHGHTTEKPHPCDLCPLAFKTATELKRHRERHTAQRDIPCDICGSMFKTRNDVLVHARNVHDGAKRYPCAVCGKLFVRSDHRNKHQRNVHRLEEMCYPPQGITEQILRPILFEEDTDLQ